MRLQSSASASSSSVNRENRTPQSRLHGEERKKNAEGIYRARIPEKWRGKRLVLVDDVIPLLDLLIEALLAPVLREREPSPLLDTDPVVEILGR